MPRPFTALMVTKTGEHIEYRGAFPDDAWELLLHFASSAQPLFNTSVAQGSNTRLSIRFDANEGMSWTAELPADDEIAAFLHRLRPFVLKREPTYLPSVAKVLSRHMAQRELRRAIRWHLDLFLGRQFQSQLVIKSNDTVLNAEATLLKWLNAHEYHLDSEKRAELDTLHSLLPLEASRAIFFSMMIDKCKAVAGLVQMIGAIEKRSGTFVKMKMSEHS